MDLTDRPKECRKNAEDIVLPTTDKIERPSTAEQKALTEANPTALQWGIFLAVNLEAENLGATNPEVASSEAMSSELMKVEEDQPSLFRAHLRSRPASHIPVDCICLAEDTPRKTSAVTPAGSEEGMRRKVSMAGISKQRISEERALAVAIRTTVADTPEATAEASIMAKK
jgi:hypothetical protein